MNGNRNGLHMTEPSSPLDSEPMCTLKSEQTSCRRCSIALTGHRIELTKQVTYLTMSVAEAEAGLNEAEQEHGACLVAKFKDETIESLEQKLEDSRKSGGEITAEVDLLKEDLALYKGALKDKVDEKAKLWENKQALEATLDDVSAHCWRRQGAWVSPSGLLN